MKLLVTVSNKGIFIASNKDIETSQRVYNFYILLQKI